MMPPRRHHSATQDTPRLLQLYACCRWLPAVFAVAIAYVPVVEAYLDPGTGSMLLQGLIAGIAVALGTVSLYWHRFKSFLSNLFSRKPSTDSTPESNTNKKHDNEPNAD
jgi:hypothetical protein